MQYTRRSLLGVTIAAVLCKVASGQEPSPAQALGKEAPSIPPRATPGDYQAHGQAGTLSIGAEFTGHSIPTPEAILTTEDYVAVEVGLFGPPDARVKLSHDDFSLRIDGKKTILTAMPYGALFKSLKDPEWVPPNAAGNKSKSSISTGDKSADGGPAPTPHMPIELERAMDQRLQK